jgi:aspartate/methionine/tyrosine aminotransferase
MAGHKSRLRVAKRLDEVGFSEIVQVRNRVMELRAAGKVVHGFHGGEPFFETPDPVKYALTKALTENQTRYAPSSGIEPLRAALAQKLSNKNHIPAGVNNVLVTAGGAHAIYVAFQAVLDPGDDVLLFSPFWTPIREMINGAQARPLLVPTSSARRHGLTATLEKMTTSHTRAIYYNTPQNPAGTVFTRSEAEEVAAFARKHDLIVISDEAYEDLVYDGEHFSIASLPGMAERTISTFTFSKSYGMTGWRVGYLTAQEPFMTGLRKLVLYSVNGVSTPTQWAALEALSLPEETCWSPVSTSLVSSARYLAALFTRFPESNRSIRRVARRRRSSSKRRMSQPSPVQFSELRVKATFDLGMQPLSKPFTAALRRCGIS